MHRKDEETVKLLIEQHEAALKMLELANAIFIADKEPGKEFVSKCRHNLAVFKQRLICPF